MIDASANLYLKFNLGNFSHTKIHNNVTLFGTGFGTVGKAVPSNTK